jgi:hypothetical protein
VAEFLGFDTQAKQTREFLAGSGERIAAAKAREIEIANQASLAAIEKATSEQLEAIKKAEEAYDKAQVSYIESVTEGVKSPIEKNIDEFRKLTTAIDGGKITIDIYRKAIANLIKDLDEVDLDKLRKAFGNPYGVIPKDTGPSISDQKRFAAQGLSAEMFGTGTLNTIQKVDKEGKVIPAFSLPEGMQIDIDIKNDEKERISNLADTLKNSSKSLKETFDKQVADIESASLVVDKYGNSIISAADKTYALNEATKQFGINSTEAYIKSNEEIFKFVALTDDLASGFGNAIAAGQSFGEALRNVFQDLTKQIIAMILRSIILQSILAAIGVVAPTGSKAPAAFAAMMNIKPMASGGPVNANSPYMVGEVGPELFVPRSNGVIVPNSMMGNGRESTQVVQNIYVQTGVAQTVRAEMAALLPAFKQQAIAGVVEAKQRGGSYARALSPA